MRARVEVVIRDEALNIVSQLAPHEIDLKNQSLHDIEGAVEAWKQQAGVFAGIKYRNLYYPLRLR
jgi:hypothetical protein